MTKIKVSILPDIYLILDIRIILAFNEYLNIEHNNDLEYLQWFFF